MVDKVSSFPSAQGTPKNSSPAQRKFAGDIAQALMGSNDPKDALLALNMEKEAVDQLLNDWFNTVSKEIRQKRKNHKAFIEEFSLNHIQKHGLKTGEQT